MNREDIRILVVDDDPFVRDMVGFILQAAGYFVDTAENGREAMDRCAAGNGFHAVISDMNMPEMDGLALIREMKKTWPDIAAILMTGDEDERGSGSGADACVVKDENLQDTIASMVETVIAGKGDRG